MTLDNDTLEEAVQQMASKHTRSPAKRELLVKDLRLIARTAASQGDDKEGQGEVKTPGELTLVERAGVRLVGNRYMGPAEGSLPPGTVIVDKRAFEALKEALPTVVVEGDEE